MAVKTESHPRSRGEHCLNVFISYELKSELRALAEKYDRTVADLVRALLRIGIPMMQGLTAAEDIMVKDPKAGEIQVPNMVFTLK